MDNEINPLAKHSQHFSKYALFYRGIIFEDERSRELREKSYGLPETERRSESGERKPAVFLHHCIQSGSETVSVFALHATVQESPTKKM